MLNQKLLEDDKETPYIPKNYGQYYYDLRNFKANNISMKKWDSIPSDKSESSFLWENSSCFKPNIFLKNSKRKSGICQDSVYITFFILNIFILIGLSIYYYYQKQQVIEKLQFFDKYKGFYSEYYNRQNYPHFENEIFWVFFESFFFSFFVNFLFFISMILFYRYFFYFYFSFSTLLYICIIFNKIPNPGLFFFLSIWGFSNILSMLNLMKNRIDFLNVFLGNISSIIKKNLSILSYSFFYIVLLIIVNIFFFHLVISIDIVIINQGKTTIWFFLYILLSYSWIINTLSYVYYLNCSSFFGSLYFLKDTEYNVCYFEDYFKKNLKYSFGAAAKSGLILPIKEKTLSFGDGYETSFYKEGTICHFCCFLPFLNCFEGISPLLHRSGLFYAANFSIPIHEGSNRWFELCYKKQIHLINLKNPLEKIISSNFFVFLINKIYIAYLSYFLFSKLQKYINIFLFLTLFNLFGHYNIFEKPLLAVLDCFIIGMGEDRKRMKILSYEFYKYLKNSYKKNLDELFCQ